MKVSTTIKNIAKKTGKVLLWMVASMVGLVVLVCSLMMIPAVQTRVAHKVTEILSEKMQAEVYIGKLRVDFALNIKLEDIRLNDQYGNNLISAKKGSLSFPSFNTETANVEIRNIILDEADVTFRKYESDTALNLQFFIEFVRPKNKKEKPSVIDLQKIQLKNSRFQLRNDALAGKDKDEVWNYSNMIVENINLKLDQILIIGDSLNLYIDQLSARERSGFQIDKFSGHLVIFRQGLHCLNTHFATANKSEINVDFRFDYTDFPDFQDFINKVKFNTDLHKSHLNLADLVYFVPAFKGMNNFVEVAATVKGTITDYKIRNLALFYGQSTEIKGDMDLQGLPIIDETFIDFTIKKLKTNAADLALFSLPKDKKIPIPDVVKKIQWVETQGHIVGMYNNFFADATFSTAAGNASCEVMLNLKSDPISYDGKLQTNNLALGKLLNNNDFGNINMTGQITGKGVRIDDLDFRLQSTVSNITFRNNTVKNILISGDFLSKQFDGQVRCDDEAFNLQFNGLVDFNHEDVNCNFDATINALNLSNLQLFRPDSNVIVSAHISMNSMGKDLDHFRGRLSMDSLVYQENNTPYSFPDFSLTIEQETYPNKTIQLKSKVLNADISGKFTYLQAFAAVQKNLHDQLPNLIPFPTILDTITQEIFDQQLNMSLNLTESIPFLEHFVPNIRINEGVAVALLLDPSKKTGYISVEVPQLEIIREKQGKINKQQLNNLSVVNQQNGKVFNLDVTCDSYFTKQTDSLPDVQKFDFQSVITNNVIDFFATATGNKKNKLSDILLEGSVKFMDMKKGEMEIVLNSGSIVWDKEAFLFDASNHIYFAKDSLFIRNFGLHAQDGKSIVIQSVMTEKNEPEIHFNFNKINLGLFNVFLNQYQISLNGELTGNGRLIQNTHGYALGSTVEIDDFQFNDIGMGFFAGRTYWNNIEKKLFMQASIFETKNNVKDSLLTIRGSFDPKEKYINLVGKADSLNVRVLEPYLKSFASRVEGFGKGEVSLKGKISDPKLTGSIVLKKAVLGIDFLKTDYFIEQGTIEFVDTGFIFNNIACKDKHNGNGYVNGIITHNKLRDFGVNLKINASNLMVLNTTMKDNNLFYGKAFATGTASISGKVNDILSISADVTTNPLTDISLSLDWGITVTESDFIRFVSFETEKEKTDTLVEKSQSSKMEVNLRVTATPDAVVRVLLDPTIGGTIVGRGNGTIEMILDKDDNFNMYGPFTISTGTFDINLAGVLTRSFKIESGGTISWNGYPTQAIMNVRAVYAKKVSVNDFFGEEERANLRPVTVNSIVSLNGRLLNPDMSFTFILPDADELLRANIYSAVDTTNREEMVRQVMYVLMMGKFETKEGSSIGNTANNTINYSVGELLSSQISKFVSSISQNIDVRVNYRQGENSAENEYTADFEWRVLNDRLSIRTSLGLLERQDMDNQNRLLGDFVAEYDVIRDGSLKAKAFNITNPQDVLPSTYSSTYSQGVGLSFSKDFDKFKDLFIRKSKKRTKTVPAQPAGLPEEKEGK